MDRRDEFGNPIRSTDEEEYERATGYRAGPEGYGPYGTTGYGVSTGGLDNPPESGGQQQQMRPGQQRGFGYEQSGQRQQQQMRPGHQTGPGFGQTESGQQAGFGYGQTGFGSTGQTGYRREGGRKEY